MNKEESMLQKRLVELSRLAYNRGIVIFSDFLNLNELNILHTTPKDMFYLSIKLMVDMTYQSVRWLFFYLMLFIMIMNIPFRL